MYSLDHIVAEGETEQSEQMNIFAGGKGLNQSVAVSRAGAKVYHAGCIGKDGDMLFDVLNGENIDTSLVKKLPEPNGHAIIQVSCKGENSIFVYPGTNRMITREYVDVVLAGFGKGDIVILQNEINSIDYIIEKAFKSGMTVILNPSPINDDVLKLDLNMISYIVLNEIEAKKLFGGTDAEASIFVASQKYPKLHIVLTKGVHGSIYHGPDGTIFQNAYKVEAVDTTAAGDTFMGYFVAGIANRLPLKTVLRQAAAASAIAVSRHGASPSVPHVSEVLRKIGTMSEHRTNAADDALKQKIDEYILNNIKDVTIEGLAKELHYSYHSIGRAIKKITGKSYTEYVVQLRVVFAAKLLKETNMPVSEIIEFVGYENESFFRRKFKEQYGTAPNKFRNAGRKQE